MTTHAEQVLITGLSGLHRDLSDFVLAVLEADVTKTAWPHEPEAEAILALRMVELAGQLELRARKRALATDAVLAGSVARMAVGDQEPSD